MRYSQTEARRLALQGGAKGGPVGLEILRMDTGIPLLARSLAGAGAGILPAEQLDQAMRHPQPVVGDVPVVDAFRHGLDDKGVPFLRGPQARLGGPQRLGDRALLFERLVALAAQFGDELRGSAGLLVEHRDLPTYAAMTYAALGGDPPVLGPRQAHGEFAVLPELAVDRYRAAVLLRDDVVADRQAEAGALAGRLGREERLEQPVARLGRDADAVVAHPDLDRVAEIARRHASGSA